jgi:hypothetical protein
MRKTLADAPDVGLAARWIGEPLQFSIIQDNSEMSASRSVVCPASAGVFNGR